MQSTGFLAYRFLQQAFLGMPQAAVEEEEPETPVISVAGRWGWRLVFYDKTGLKVGEISSDMGAPILENFDCAVTETGCGEFSFTLSEMPSFTLDYRYRVDLHLFGESAPRYSGYIIQKPDERDTSRSYDYGGHGFYHQLQKCGVNRAYENWEVSAIVKDIMVQDIQPYTDVVLNAVKIVQTSPAYRVVSVKFDRVSAKDALKELSEYAQNYQVGVDHERELFFRPVSEDVVADAIKWVGQHIETLAPESDIDDVLNKIDIIGGEIEEGSNYSDTVDDEQSQIDYGVCWGKKTIPSALSAEDAKRWGDYQLSKLKDPVEKAKVKNIELFLEDNFTAYGLMRIYDPEGEKLELPIKKVSYKISAKDGVRCDADLGDVEVMPIDEEFVDMERRIKTAEALAAINTEQLA